MKSQYILLNILYYIDYYRTYITGILVEVFGELFSFERDDEAIERVPSF